MRGSLPVGPLNRVLEELRQWRQPTLMLVGNHDQVPNSPLQCPYLPIYSTGFPLRTICGKLMSRIDGVQPAQACENQWAFIETPHLGATLAFGMILQGADARGLTVTLFFE